jgi:hypothetical protein
MARKSIALDREQCVPAPTVKTGTDALEFYRGKTTWLGAKKIARIERPHRAKRRSLRT